MAIVGMVAGIVTISITDFMKTRKVTLTIVVEVLSIDAAACKVIEAVEQVRQENNNGQLTSDDGDTVTWNTKYQNVEI